MTGKELKIKIKNLGIELKELAEILKISPQALNSKLQADDLKVSFVKEIATSINKSVYSLIGDDFVIDQKPSSTINSIPLIPVDAMAGFNDGNTLQVMEYDTDRYIIPEFTELNVEFLIRMKGSSMLPKYNSGDILGCRRLPMDTFFQWNKVYVVDTIQGALVKRVHKSEKPGFITCVSDNENYPPFELNFDTDVNAIAIVLGVIRLE